MIKTLRNKKGVTLVELLAVVVILGIIAAIAVPTIGGLIRRQEANAAQATYDTIVTAAELYAENEDAFTLDTLVQKDFVDLKDNKFGWALDNNGDLVEVSTTLIWVKVVEGTVTFHQDNSGTAAATATPLLVNGFEVE